jgi:signal transduction histidine kinase/phage shock protein PspC (stress-responsive transcriptional regulator)
VDRVAPPIPDIDEPVATPRSRHRPVRSARDRVITGVAGGIGERLGVDPTVVRLAFVALSLAAGIGVLAYLVAALVSVEPEPSPAPRPAAGTSVRQALAFGLIVLGVLLLLRAAGLWFGDRIVWPVVLVALGSAVIWTRGDEVDRTRWSALMRRLPEGSQRVLSGSAPRVRLGIAAVLIAAGLAQFLIWSGPDGVRRNAPLAALATLVGVAVIAGPWFWRAARQLTEERRQRIRSQERAEVAAHLHDSVLQTLALIQRSGEPREMTTLARSQERELRSWLWGGARAADHSLLSTAMNDAAAEVERTHRVAIDVVTTGDCRLDEPVRALVLAAREAMVNSATHSGVRRASVFVETDATEVSAYVRDQGAGFDRETVPPDRRGIADSIEGRIARFGGIADVRSSPGVGTDVRLRVPRGTA